MALVEESWTHEGGVEGVLDSGVQPEELKDKRRRGCFESRSASMRLILNGLEDGGGALLKGDLMTRPKDGEGPWKATHYVLEKGRLLVFEDRHHVRPKQVITAKGTTKSCTLETEFRKGVVWGLHGGLPRCLL